MTMPQPTNPIDDALTPEQAAALRAELEHVLAEHEQRLARVVDSDDAMGKAMQERSERSAEEIRDALARFEAGTYGDCIRCGGPIQIGRLEAIPHVATCSACAAGDRRR